MLAIIKRIFKIGIVTEKYNKWQPSNRFRGQLRYNDSTVCEGCQKCVDICPTKALMKPGSGILINYHNCTFCGECARVCPTKTLFHSHKDKLAEFGEHLTVKLRREIKNTLGRSLHIRHLDAGSCNACDFELTALLNPVYDLQQYGIDFVASPRHADMLMVTGCVTHNLTQALKMTYAAAAEPKLVMAIGACACGGEVFGGSYAINNGAVGKHLPVDVYVHGCPPRPAAVIQGLLKALGKMK
ncbi:MAG: 4Fe-4S binding protein [Negativicutes bacterium]|jgi:Ni,Fe-hydrogenase III small subunit/ferredoxin